MTDIEPLLEIMRRLRHPDQGCPWDRAQDFRSIVPYTLEEAYEVADAIERQDWAKLPDELGDLLFQVVFYAQIAEERSMFDFGAVLGAIENKLIRRHPHVFGDQVVDDAAQQSLAWEAHKAQERQASEQPGLLDDIPLALPALTRAAKLQRRAARVGLDWPAVDGVLERVQQEIDELRAAIASADDEDIEDELGDVLFSVVNLARHLQRDPEQALQSASRKFEQRVRWMEQTLAASDETLDGQTPEQLEQLWQAAKRAQRRD